MVASTKYDKTARAGDNTLFDVFPPQLRWKVHTGVSLTQIAISSLSQHVWGIQSPTQIHYYGGTAGTPCVIADMYHRVCTTRSWQQVPSPTTGSTTQNQLNYVAVGDQDGENVFALATSNTPSVIWWREGFTGSACTSPPCPFGSSWKMLTRGSASTDELPACGSTVDTCMDLETISLGGNLGDQVFGMAKNGRVWGCQKIETTGGTAGKCSGSGWKLLARTLMTINNGGMVTQGGLDGQFVYGVTGSTSSRYVLSLNWKAQSFTTVSANEGVMSIAVSETSCPLQTKRYGVHAVNKRCE